MSTRTWHAEKYSVAAENSEKVLKRLVRDAWFTIKDLAEGCDLRQPLASDALKDLCSRGLALRKYDPKGDRFRLSERGLKYREGQS